MPTTPRRGGRIRRSAEDRRIYCAGPLFNRAEQAEMAEIAAALEGAGFAVFLPQRDGLIFAELYREMRRGGYESNESQRMIQQAIFWLDTYQVIRGCEGILINLNGRVPDEGAVAEAAMAWMAGKVIVLHKSDVRSLLLGADNPLVSGLGGFVRVSTIPEIAYAFTQIFRTRRLGRPSERPLPPAVQRAVESGHRLSKVLASRPTPAEIVPAIVSLSRADARGASR